MVSYNKSMDTSYEGTMTREVAPGDIVNEALAPDFNWADYGFGRPVKYDGKGKIVGLGATDKGESICGMLVRAYIGGTTLGSERAHPILHGGAQSVARRGFMGVKLYGKTAAKKGAPVFVRIVLPASKGTNEAVLGGIEAAADSSNTIQLPNAQFEGPAGPDGITEISFNLQ